MTTRPPAEVGTPADAIDTPALLVELDAYERNLDRMTRALDGLRIRLRPHAKTHKSPVVALHQIARGAVGVCCQKVGEAEAMVWGGVRDVLVTNEIVGSGKIARLAALAAQAVVGVCVDDADNVRHLGEAATRAGARLGVLVEVDVGAGRCGVPPGEPAVALARRVAAEPGLRFLGLQAYHGSAQHVRDETERRAVVNGAVERVRETVAGLRAAGLGCDVVSGAGTGTYPFEAESGIYTEIQPGSYVFMDADYRRVAGPPAAFEQSLFVLTTVMSRPASDRAIVDAGLKALGVDSGMPLVEGRPDLEYTRASDEHGVVRLREAGTAPRVGATLRLIPGHCDPTVNLYDWYVAVRGGRVAALWPIAARGAVR